MLEPSAELATSQHRNFRPPFRRPVSNKIGDNRKTRTAPNSPPGLSLFHNSKWVDTHPSQFIRGRSKLAFLRLVTLSKIFQRAFEIVETRLRRVLR
jgi:hypothetical protein